jgi:hypothetical protein
LAPARKGNLHLATIGTIRRFCLAIDKKRGRVYYTDGRRSSAGGRGLTGIFVLDLRDVDPLPAVADAGLNPQRRRTRRRGANKTG